MRSILVAFLAKETREELEDSDWEGDDYHHQQTQAIGSNRPAGPTEAATGDSDSELLQLEHYLDKELEDLAGTPEA